MKKRMNILFFGTCFLASLLAEGYCFQVFDGKLLTLLSIVGIGIVVLITGYLLMDSIRSQVISNMKKVMFYMDHLLQEETQRWNERYTEIINLQKATYTATKKNTVIMAEQIDKILSLLEAQENNSLNERKTLIDLQKKSMEGQKNALNMQLHYNKDNTNLIVEAIRGQDQNAELHAQIVKMLELMEVNNNFLHQCMVRIEEAETVSNQEHDEEAASYSEKIDFDENEYQTQDYNSNNFKSDDYDVDEFDFHKDGSDEVVTKEDYISEDYSPDNILPDEMLYENPVESEILQDEIQDRNQDEIYREDLLEEGLQENLSPEDMATIDPELQENKEESGFSAFFSEPTAVNKTVKPLYADPNKALTADEIAALFASAGN
jgi:hypothetical protein